MSETDDGAVDLSKLFDDSLDLVHAIDGSQLETNSSEFQADVKKCIKQLEETTTMINQLGLFSSNEDIDEVATNELKYMLAPALLGYLTTKLHDHDRSEILSLARTYFRDYLKRLNSYGVIKARLEESDEEEPSNNFSATADASLEAAARKRQDKIRRYRAIKEMETELDRMKTCLSTAEDEILRKYYITLLKKWAGTMTDELENLEFELNMLRKMKDRPTSAKIPAKKRQPLKPFIITKDALQKKVFGLGYPSVPTMTVNEFVDKKMDEGTWAFSNKKVYNNSLQNWAENPEEVTQQDENEEERKERLAEKEDPDELRKTRDWDDFKDDTKRGSGNRKNMS
ncbi:Immunoglobulin-binding protein 1b [Halotydeus destructor]|nr:Immunoglobulin-binding protein 1b [Halotydeus destructor]